MVGVRESRQHKQKRQRKSRMGTGLVVVACVLGVIGTVLGACGYAAKTVSLSVSGVATVRRGRTTKYDFGLAKEPELFIAPADGDYKIELWGASGGSAGGYAGGRGAYTAGEIHLTAGTQLWVVVGGAGVANVTSSNYATTGGYNGGGYGSYRFVSAGGGGATDVRIDKINTRSRIMVAAGGGGSAAYRTDIKVAGIGGAGGGLNGKNGTHIGNYAQMDGKGATQTAGGTGWDSSHYGSFAQGANSPVPSDDRPGGGGGYYGGGAGYGSFGAGGGSSFISGHSGCNAIQSASSTAATGQSVHYSGMKFTNTVMTDGDSVMPSWSTGGTMTGNTGDGRARITRL